MRFPGAHASPFPKTAADSVCRKQYEIISSISLKDLAVTILSPAEAFNALVTNNETDVVYRNPFKFSLQAIQAGGDFIMYVLYPFSVQLIR